MSIHALIKLLNIFLLTIVTLSDKINLHKLLKFIKKLSQERIEFEIQKLIEKRELYAISLGGVYALVLYKHTSGKRR